jgi:hypothetical protein
MSALKVSCPVTTPAQDEIETLVKTNRLGLRYDTTGRQFVYNWKTPIGTGCYKVTASFADGVGALTANFSLRK